MPTHARRQLRLPADHQSPAHARAAVREVLAEAGLADLMDEALLLTTELSTNGVVHAGTDIDVDVRADSDGITVTVTDFLSGTLERPGYPDLLSEGGRGLLLVDQFASAWGTTHDEDGKGVWFRLERSDTTPPPGPPSRSDWLTFLAETSELLAQSLDPELTLALIPQLLVARLGDWAAVHTADEWDNLHLATWLHRDETELPLLKQQLEASTARLQEATHAPITLAHPLQGVVVPLIARGRRLGTLAVGRPADRLHSPDDVAVIEDLARRAALAIDNARIHAEREEIAQAFQRALLPAALPTAVGIELAAEYVPASTGTDVGGDFYDVLPLGEDRWLLSIGDVCGKGAQAAALTGLVRDVLRVLVRDGRPLPRVLELLNTTMLERGDGRFATLAAAIVERLPDGALSVDLYLAGHDKPVLLRADGSTTFVGLSGTAVGLLEEVRNPRSVLRMETGDALVFYTDGVTERRRGDELYGQDRLRTELAGLAGHTATGIAARIRAATMAFSPEQPRDDIALLVLRVEAPLG